MLTPPPEHRGPASSLMSDCEELVRRHMATNDPSHDYLHIERVRAMAVKLAHSHPDGPLDTTVVELGALFHDMIDHKYVTNDKCQALVAEISSVMLRNGLSAERTAFVIQIVESTGYSVEKRLRLSGNWTEWHDTCPEYHCVQDADRLDAIGAFGIFRVSCFACSTNEALYNQKKPEGTVHRHFYDKLLYLKDTLRTPLGIKAGEQRQRIMEQFVRAVEQEADLLDFN